MRCVRGLFGNRGTNERSGAHKCVPSQSAHTPTRKCRVRTNLNAISARRMIDPRSRVRLCAPVLRGRALAQKAPVWRTGYNPRRTPDARSATVMRATAARTRPAIADVHRMEDSARFSTGSVRLTAAAARRRCCEFTRSAASSEHTGGGAGD